MGRNFWSRNEKNETSFYSYIHLILRRCWAKPGRALKARFSNTLVVTHIYDLFYYFPYLFTLFFMFFQALDKKIEFLAH